MFYTFCHSSKAAEEKKKTQKEDCFTFKTNSPEFCLTGKREKLNTLRIVFQKQKK